MYLWLSKAASEIYVKSFHTHTQGEIIHTHIHIHPIRAVEKFHIFFFLSFAANCCFMIILCDGYSGCGRQNEQVLTVDCIFELKYSVDNMSSKSWWETVESFTQGSAAGFLPPSILYAKFSALFTVSTQFSQSFRANTHTHTRSHTIQQIICHNSIRTRSVARKIM